jgi:hypothetical protein
MTAPNHALTGALIGLTVSNPVLAMPLAFASHFVCDAIPHYDLGGPDKAKLFRSRRFVVEFLLLGALGCLALVVLLALAKPEHWFVAAICAFLAASPDLFWFPRFLSAQRTGTEKPLKNLFLRFHSGIQWLTGPRFFWLEAVWFVACGAIILAKL